MNEVKKMDELVGEFLGNVFVLTGTRLTTLTVEWDGELPIRFVMIAEKEQTNNPQHAQTRQDNAHGQTDGNDAQSIALETDAPQAMLDGKD